MVRRVDVNDLSSFMTQNDKDIQESEGRCGDGGWRSGEEVYRYQAFSVHHGCGERGSRKTPTSVVPQLSQVISRTTLWEVYCENKLESVQENCSRSRRLFALTRLSSQRGG